MITDPGNEGAIRFGEADLANCDREPIHIPGSIQPHGVLLVVDRHGLAVEQVAGDTLSLLGFSPQEILDHSVCELFESEIEVFVRSPVSPSHS
ncbi:MAG: multi-sensor signal transduction histidine kinase [Gammaproteobacteria bacterium]|nr:multi-sensor signal transduction histidine kinase [Gammaproteobacteria bacterium]